MACLINRDDAGNLTSVLSPHNKKESTLFNNLKERMSPSNALLLWGATNSPTFNSLYGGSKDDNGEPVFQENDKQIWFLGKDNTPFFVQDKSTIIDVSRSDIREGVSEALSDETSYDWRNQPLSDVTEKMLEEKTLDEMKPFLEKIFLKTKAALDVTKAILTEKKKVTYKAGEKERYFLGFQQLSGVSFNDDGLAQGFMQGYSYKDWDPTLDYADNNKIKLWDKNGFPDSKRLEFNGEFLNAEEYLVKTKKNLALGSLKGKVIHLYDQWNYASSDKRKTIELEISNLINTYNATQEVDKQIKDSYMTWVKDVKKEVDSRLALSPNDKVIHELQIVSPELGIIGSIDKYIIREDGTITIRDIKTSESLLVNNDYISFFKHSNIEATALNKAKFQVFLYALAVGLKNDNVRFSHLGVDMLSSVNRAGQMAADQSLSRSEIEDFIRMFNRYINEESGNKNSPHNQILERIKNHPTALKNWLNPNNTSNYISALDIQPTVDEKGNIYYSDVRNETHVESAIRNVTMAMGIMQTATQFREKALEDHASNIYKQYKNMDANILKFVNIWSEGGMDPSMWNRDISFMNMWAGGTIHNVRHPLVSVYNKYLETQKRARDAEHNANMDKAKAYFLPVLNKWRKDAGMATMKSPNEAWTFFLALRKGDFLSSKFSKNWDSMYKTITVDGVTEKVPMSGDELRAKGMKEEAAFQDYLQSVYEKELNSPDAYVYQDATYTNKNGKFTKINHIDVFNGQQIGAGPYRNWSYKGMTEKVDEEGKVIKVPFMARVPMHDYEYFDKLKDSGNKVSKIREYFIKYLTSFWTNKIDAGEQGLDVMHVPLRHLGKVGDNLDKHSKDMMYAFENFSMNVTNKKYMDTVLALGEGMALHLEQRNTEKDEVDKVKNLVKFLKLQSHFQSKNQLASDDSIRNIRKTTDALFRVPIKVQKPNGGGYDEYVLSLYTLLVGMKNLSVHVVMGLSVTNALQNLVQAVTATARNAANFKLGSYFLMGGDDEVYDFDLTGIAKGLKEALTAEDTAINGGNPVKKKLFLIARDINYMGENNSAAFALDNSMTSPNKFMNSKHLFAMNSSVENLNRLSTLYAQLQLKVKVNVTQPDGSIKEEKKSMWDLYDVVESEDINGEKIYKAEFKQNASRGKRYENGSWIDTKGITAAESIKLKRVFEKINGAYMPEERSILGMYFLGEMALAFKKFFPSMLRNMFESKRMDSSLGRYVEKKNLSGETYLEWEDRVVVGKYRLLTSLIFGSALNKLPLFKNGGMLSVGDTISWSNLSKAEQMEMLDFATSLSMWLVFMSAGYKDDDDQKDNFSRFMFNLGKTVVQPISLMSAAETAGKFLTPVAVNQFINLSLGATQLAGQFALVALGVEDDMRNDAGNIVGFKNIAKNIPYVSSVVKLQNAIEDMEENTTRGNR